MKNFGWSVRNHLTCNFEISNARRHRRGAWLAGLSGLAMLGGFIHPTPALAASTDPRLAFGQCTPGVVPTEFAATAECGSILVPVDRAKPAGRKLRLPIVRFPSPAGDKAEPLFVLNGGPGEANLSHIKSMVAVQRDRDIYYVGYRGADDPGALNCPEVAPVADMPNLMSEKTLGALSSAVRACAVRLQASGIDLSRYTMFEVIEDLEQVRTALGHAKVNLLSVSYGTRVAQFYSRRHPGSVARSVMWAANPPGHFVFSSYVNDKVLNRVVELCSADPGCSTRTPDLRKTIQAALTAGARTGDPSIDDGRTQTFLFASLYGRAKFSRFLEAALAAEAGNLAPLAEAGKKFADSLLKGVIWGDLLAKGGLDSFRYADFEPTFAATATSMGSPFDRVFSAGLNGWPQAEIPVEYRRAALDPTPTLVLNGDIDISTPLTFVEAELMPYLPNGRLVAFKDYGHSDLNRQAGPLDVVIGEFLRSGRVDTSPLADDPYVFGK